MTAKRDIRLLKEERILVGILSPGNLAQRSFNRLSKSLASRFEY